MLSDPDLKRVSVGDILSDSGVKYYGIPLRYGAPFYRCAVIADEVVIVEPSTDRVIEGLIRAGHEGSALTDWARHGI